MARNGNDDLTHELEEELLAVAGRGSKKRKKQRSESDEDKDDRRASKSKRRPQQSASKNAAVQEEEELESEYDDGYGSDLMGDDDDRARLAAMTELDREMELADRAETREKELERRQTMRALKDKQRLASQASNMRSSTRAKGVDQAKKSAMAELVAAKNAKARKSKEEEKAKSGWHQTEAASRKEKEEEEEVSDVSDYEVSERSEAAASDVAAESLDVSKERRRDELSDLDSEEEEEVLTRQPDEESEEAEHKNILQVQVRRYMLEKWQSEPFFERSLPGAVVRLAIGSHRYFMAQIVHVEERSPGHYKDPGIFRMQSPYEFPAKGSKTSKWLYVQRGTSPRLMPMTLISNHGITDDEFKNWQNQCDKDNRPQITLAEVDEVKQRLKAAQNYVYTAEDVAKMVDEKRARGDVANIAREKSRLAARREKALETNDTDALELLDQQIAELEARASARAKGTQKVPEAGKRSLAEVNKQNALRNMENALRNVTSRPEGSRNLTADGVDPFSRRQTRPMNYWSTKRNTGSTQEAGPDVEEANADVVEEEDVAVTPRATAVENEFGGIDLNIDLTAIQKLPAKSLLLRRLLGPKWDAHLPTKQDCIGKKTLTLADYKRRQGIV